MSSNTENTEQRIKSLKEYFLKNYIPAEPSEKNVLFMSTNEIYQAFYKLYPSKDFDALMVASWLIEGGFKFIDMSGWMKFEWVLKGS